ncbi:two-component regulator propeller domain-containing protein [Bacteroidota bacterium]
MLRISNFFFIGLFIFAVSCFDPPEDAITPDSVDKWEYYTTTDGLANNSVRSIYKDRLGNMWFGTYGGGVSKYANGNWTTYDTGDGLVNDSVLAVIEDKDRYMWFGTVEGFSLFDGSEWTNVPDLFGYEFEAHAFIQDRSGTVWVGTDFWGILTFGDQGFLIYLDYDCFECNFINELYKDSNGDIWIGTVGGLKKFKGGDYTDNSNYTLYTTQNGLPDNYVEAIYEDSDGDLWVGTYFGESVAILKGNSFEEVSLYNGLPMNPVFSILEDTHKNLWFGTYGIGVIKYDRVLMRTLKEGQGPSENIIYSSAIDLNGNIWLGHNESGVSKYIPK